MSLGWNNIEALSQGEWRYNVACLGPGGFIYVIGMHVYILIMEWPNAYNISQSQSGQEIRRWSTVGKSKY